jgi:hypothetical protein
LQLFDLRRESANLRLESIDAARIGAAAPNRRNHARRRRRAARARQRFERTDHNLKIDELLFELLNSAAKISITAATASRLCLGGGRRGIRRRLRLSYPCNRKQRRNHRREPQASD